MPAGPLNRPSSRRQRAGVLVVAVLLLGGCAAGGLSGSFWHPPTAPTSAAPTFDGPFADEFAAAWAESASDLEREVLADGVITDAERADLHT